MRGELLNFGICLEWNRKIIFKVKPSPKMDNLVSRRVDSLLTLTGLFFSTPPKEFPVRSFDASSPRPASPAVLQMCEAESCGMCLWLCSEWFRKQYIHIQFSIYIYNIYIYIFNHLFEHMF